MSSELLFVAGQFKPQYRETPCSARMHDWVAATLYDLRTDAALVGPKDWPAQRPDRAFMPQDVTPHAKGYLLTTNIEVVKAMGEWLGPDWELTQTRTFSGAIAWVYHFVGRVPPRARKVSVWIRSEPR